MKLKDFCDLDQHPKADEALAAVLGAALAPRARQDSVERETTQQVQPEGNTPMEPINQDLPDEGPPRWEGPPPEHEWEPSTTPAPGPPTTTTTPARETTPGPGTPGPGPDTTTATPAPDPSWETTSPRPLFDGPPLRGLLPDDPPDFPSEVLPPWLGRWVRDTARVKAVRSDMPGALALGVASCVAAWTPDGTGPIKVTDGDMAEPLNLYCVAVEESGSNKSGVLWPALAPLREIAKELVEAGAPERAARQAVRVALQVEVDALTDQLKASAKADKSGKEWKGKDALTLREDLADAVQKLDAAPRPVDLTLIESDTTPEALATALADNPALCLATSEGNEVFALITGRYGNGPNLDLMLKAWDGESADIRRKTTGSLHIERPTLAWALAVQPVTVRKLSKFDGDLNERGLVGRILFAWPKTVIGTRCPPSGERMSEAVTEGYRVGIRRLFEARASVNGEGGAQPIPLGIEANKLFAQFYRDTESPMADGADLAWCRSMVSKMRSQALRFAGLLHLAGGAGSDEAVTVDTMRGNRSAAPLKVGTGYAARARVARG